MGYRARSSFKLLQIDEQFNLLSRSKRVVDLCAAPGSWSQVVAQKLENELESKQAKLVAVDLQEMAPIKGVENFKGDITSKQTTDKIIAMFKGERADLVMSDGAPDVTGLHEIDNYLQGQLILAGLRICHLVLGEKGNFIAKIFRGKYLEHVLEEISFFFEKISIAKPKASRNSSVEAFLVAEKFRFASKFIPTMFPSIQGVVCDQLDSKVDAIEMSFVPCGRESDYDADKNYNVAPNGSHIPLPPVQPPINPSYSNFISSRRR
eukprot:snap_masked-scaffold_6-processed-gene-17.17-mRNA-1 protein AED:0.05 eAED:0.05 QI:0/-1/0/1/-1/1/1/0/263